MFSFTASAFYVNLFALGDRQKSVKELRGKALKCQNIFFVTYEVLIMLFEGFRMIRGSAR
jgi:hypothetical protein